MSLLVADNVARLKQIKREQYELLAESGTLIQTTTPWSEYNDFFRDVLAGGGSTERFELIADEIMGSVDADNEIRTYALSLSDTCDEIIGKESLFTAYTERELDNFDELEILADEIIGAEQ